MKEIRWHARAGQGAKTASQLIALAAMRSGRSVQAFPEYGPERRGAPIRAYNRLDDSPIRRHDPVSQPDLVCVLEASLVAEQRVADGLAPDGVVVVDSDEVPSELAHVAVRAVPAQALAEKHGLRFGNLVMVGAVASALGEPPLEDIQAAAIDLLGRKVDPAKIAAVVEEGYRWQA